MHAYITTTRSTQDSITNGMNKNISIGVAEKPPFMGNFHTPQDQASPFNQPVTVISETNSHTCHLFFAAI
jgi:hypothetical protein